MIDKQGINYSEDGKTVIGVVDDFNATEIVIPEGVVDIGAEAFYKVNITKIILPSTLKQIGKRAFVECGNPDLQIKGEFDHLTFWGNFGKWSDSPINVKNITIETINNEPSLKIEDDAFRGWICLESVSMHPKCDYIGERAFMGCRNLKEVVVNNPDVEIDDCAFLNCSKLTHINGVEVGEELSINNTGLGSGLCEFYRNLPSEKTIVVKQENGDDVIFKMILVEGGTKTIGFTPEQEVMEANKISYNGPFEVTLTDYYIGETPVTKALWYAVMGETPSSPKDWDPDTPITDVSYYEVRKFIRKLNEITGINFVLPTVAQWEYAARGGIKSKNFIFAGSNDDREVAWTNRHINENWEKLSPAERIRITESGVTPKPVKKLKPNELGLYDMSGNIWEFCCDSPRRTYVAEYDFNCFRRSVNPVLSGYMFDRVAIKGGSIREVPRNCQVSSQDTLFESVPSSYCGFRLAIDNRDEEDKAVMWNRVTANMSWDEVVNNLLRTQAKEGI